MFFLDIRIISAKNSCTLIERHDLIAKFEMFFNLYILRDIPRTIANTQFYPMQSFEFVLFRTH